MKRFLILSLIALLFATGVVSVLATDTLMCKVGDADENGKINIKDATLVQKFVAGLLDLSGQAQKLADVDANGKVNVKDATLIQKFVAGLVNGFPADSQPETQSPAESIPETTHTTPIASAPAQQATKPSVDDDGYFDVIIRP